MFGPPIKTQQELGTNSAQVQTERGRERERGWVKGGATIGSCEQHSTSVSMAVAQIFTNKTESKGKEESQTEREGDKD